MILYALHDALTHASHTPNHLTRSLDRSCQATLGVVHNFFSSRKLFFAPIARWNPLQSHWPDFSYRVSTGFYLIRKYFISNIFSAWLFHSQPLSTHSTILIELPATCYLGCICSLVAYGEYVRREVPDGVCTQHKWESFAWRHAMQNVSWFFSSLSLSLLWHDTATYTCFPPSFTGSRGIPFLFLRKNWYLHWLKVFLESCGILDDENVRLDMNSWIFCCIFIFD